MCYLLIQIKCSDFDSLRIQEMPPEIFSAGSTFPPWALGNSPGRGVGGRYGYLGTGLQDAEVTHSVCHSRWEIRSHLAELETEERNGWVTCLLANRSTETCRG